MNPVVTLRDYRAQDEDLAIRLLVGKLPPEKREAAYEPRRRRWRWQYFENPNLEKGRPPIYVAEVDGAFGGMICLVPVPLRTPQGIVFGAWGMDLVVNPEIRGGGIGKRLVAEWTRPFEVSAAVGYSPVALGVTKSVGFTEQRGATTVRIVLSRARFARGLARAGSRKHLYQLGEVFLRANRGGRPDRSFAADNSPDPDPGVVDVWEEVAANYRFCVDRNMSYLRWRYTTHPHHKYRFVHLRRDQTLCAFAVVRIASEEYRLGIVSDFIVDPRRPDMVHALLDHTLAYCRSQEASAVLVDLPSVLAPSILKRYPCSLSNQLNMIVFSRHEGLLAAGIQQPDSWLISRSDSDQDY